MKNLKNKFKKIVCLLLCGAVVCALTACQNTQFPEDDAESYYEEITAYDDTITTTTDFYEEPTKGLSDIGFYDLDTISFSNGECLLAAIAGYDVENNYIYRDDANFSGLLLDSGFIETVWNIHFDNDLNSITYISNRGPYAYSIVSNDGITFGGDGSVVIKNRIPINNAVILDVKTHFASSGSALTIPANMIDWSTKDDEFYDANGKRYTKYYLY